jgi:hypothetical protein
VVNSCGFLFDLVNSACGSLHFGVRIPLLLFSLAQRNAQFLSFAIELNARIFPTDPRFSKVYRSA